MAFRSVSIVASETSIITAEGHHRESGSNQPAPFYTQHSSANQSLRHAQPLTGTKRQHADPVPVRIRALKGTEVMRDTPALRELSIFMVFTGAMRIESSVGDLWSVFHAGHITTALEDAG
jgi:hypothetical protein